MTEWRHENDWYGDYGSCPFAFFDNETGELYCTVFTCPNSSDYPKVDGITGFFTIIDSRPLNSLIRDMLKKNKNAL